MTPIDSGRLGGIASHGTTMAQHRLDVEECQAYLAAHPGATALTVAVTGGIPICSWRAWMSATEAI